MPFIVLIFIFVIHLPMQAAHGTDEPKVCTADDRACLFDDLQIIAQSIDEPQWRDRIYREKAKLLVHENRATDALLLLPQIENPDIKAMTIRGIGMAMASAEYSSEQYNPVFSELLTQAKSIDHAPSYGIALTYISMAQAMAGDDAGAMTTAKMMENEALRNKAHAENAEIQAERGMLDAAILSISMVESPSFRDKAHKLIAKIFVKNKDYDKALSATEHIQNPYQKAETLLYILADQITPSEVSLIK